MSISMSPNTALNTGAQRSPRPSRVKCGPRKRSKRRMGEPVAASISGASVLAHGFDHVSVTDIAATAEVSKPTLFRYFPTKEDLVLHRIADHQGEAARVVCDRQPGVRR